MRTTVDLPDDLMRAAKARAAERGESLKQMFTRLVASELATVPGEQRAARVQLPLVGQDSHPEVDVSNKDVEDFLMSEDAEAVEV